MRWIRGTKITTIVMALWAVAIFLFFQFWYPYHFFYQEQNQIFLWEWEYVFGYLNRIGGLALLIGDFLTQFYYYLYAGTTILTLCIVLAGLLIYKALTNLKANRWAGLAMGICVMGFLTVCHFSVSYRLSSTISIIGWLWLIWAVSAIRHRWLRWAFFLMLLPTYLLFGTPKKVQLQAPDFVLEKDFAVSNEYYFGHYEKVLDIVKNSDGWTRQMLFFYNLVNAQRGLLPDCLFDFTPNYLGTFEKIGPETPRLTINIMNELYWALGDMTFTERAAMMTNVFAPENRNVRMMKRLAECNMVSSDILAAEKYLRILDKTFVYSKWSEFVREHSEDVYRGKMQMVNHRDTITISDNAHFLMMQLLDQNPDNMVALDYILCSDLMLKDMTNFKRDYDRYCTESPRLKPLYQEALCVWLAGSEASQEEWQQYIKMNDVMQRFIDYNNQRGNPRFKGTYWYYFDKIKAPEIN